MTYYNTTNLDGDKLKKAKSKANTQRSRVHGIFMQYQVSMSASKVHAIYIDLFNNCPLTSIRRAITDLSKEGKLQKTTSKSIGLYGSPEHRYKLIK